MSPRPVTIHDIASETGVSKSTVANVLNGSGRFSEETAELVRSVAESMGYVSNRAARSLRTRRVGAVGLFIPPATRMLAFYMEFAFGAARGAERYDADLTLLSGKRNAAAQLDGALVIDPEPDSPTVRALISAGIPVITVGSYVGEGAERLAGVLEARHAELQRDALDHTWRRGRRRPVMLASDHWHPSSWGIESRRAYEAWCAERGIDAIVLEVPAEAPPYEMMRIISDAVVVHDADAVVCGTQGWAARALIFVEKHGMRVGKDIDIVTYVAAKDEVSSTVLSMVDLHPLEYGEAAAAFLGEVVARPAQPGAEPERRFFDGASVSLAR